MQDIDLRKERRWENTVSEKGRFLSSFLHRRPKLTIRGIDQIFMIYLRESSET